MGWYKKLSKDTYLRPSKSTGFAIDYYMEINTGDKWGILKITHLEKKPKLDLKDSVFIDYVEG